ncbi:Mitochondrial import inner membrane translocase subunit Tim16 [Dirofilaria immitis]|nr:Mitochondrial import inner membrane translocase subunit Tim16 [Dirofilaria immitis]
MPKAVFNGLRKVSIEITEGSRWSHVMVWRNAIKIVIATGEALSKAFTRAVQEEIRASKQAAASRAQQTGQSQNEVHEASRTNARLGISLQEAMKILNVQDPLNPEEVEKNYKHLFEINDKTKGGSLYLQSKVYRAKERIDEELQMQSGPEIIQEAKEVKRTKKLIASLFRDIFAIGSLSILEMTTFPAHLLQSVEKYGTTASFDDFKNICEKLCQKLIDDGPSKLEESICSQVYWNAAAGILVEAVRRGLSVAALEELLPKTSCHERLSENEQAIRKCMATIGWEPPQVVDVSWKLSKTLETDKGKKEMVVAEIHLDTIPTGSTVLERISFCCNSDDLQNILWKLKEAQNAVSKVENYCK